MSKKPPAKAKAKCKPGKHSFTEGDATNGWVVHKCRKCPEKITRPKDKASSGKGKK
jgi:hypothetical protein